MLKKLYKRLFNNRFYTKNFCNPFLGYQISVLGDYQGINEGNPREIPIIVSLTSYRGRFKSLPKTLYSILNQSLKPDRIILWLNEEDENLTSIPYEITQFVKNGLEIKFVKNIRSYTKAIYAFKEYPNSIIVTADDDIYYAANWLKKLYLSYISHPEDIHVHKTVRVKYNEDGILPYKCWEKNIKKETADYQNFICGAGGVLYPPKCFSREVLREDIFLKHSPNSDDVWFWVMALVNNKKIRLVKNHIEKLLLTNIFNQLFGKTLYFHNKNGGYDRQLNNLMKFYGQNILAKIKS